MSAFPTTHRPAAATIPPIPMPPPWTADYIDFPRPPVGYKTVSVQRTEAAALMTARIADAVDRTSADLLNAVRQTYADVFARSVGRVVRCWNFIPAINQIVTGDQSRYMIFNAGRYAAFLDRFGPADCFDQQVPTASAVGHTGPDLWIHALSVDVPAVHLGNPRQLSPHKYSGRYGKRPPCFARATRVGDRLLVGGTASIRGEDSYHNDLSAQTAETLVNLQTVLQSGGAGGPDDVTDVRVYYPIASDRKRIEKLLSGRFVNARAVEYVSAELCRPELLVEIEVVADTSRHLKSSHDADRIAKNPGLVTASDAGLADLRPLRSPG